MPRLVSDYSKGLIYKIHHEDKEELIYIGSTTNFTNRKYTHKSSCNNEKSKFVTSDVHEKPKDSNKESLKSTITKLLKNIEAAALKPIMNVLIQFEYRLLVVVFMSLAVAMIAFLVINPQRNNMESYLINEALANAETITHYLARANRENLILENFGSLDTAMAMTVGFPVAIGCKLILEGKIKETGVKIPTFSNVYKPILKELANYGIVFKEEKIEIPKPNGK